VGVHIADVGHFVRAPRRAGHPSLGPHPHPR
jgi:hypothetical protein